MNITLHQASEQVRSLLDEINPDTGELPPEFQQARAIVATKSVAVTAYILELERQSGLLKSYAKEISDRAKAADKRIAWLKIYLVQHMTACNITEIKDERGIFKATRLPERDEFVDIFDEDKIPKNYMREIPARYEADKVFIKKSIKEGLEVPGAKLVKRDRLSIT